MQENTNVTSSHFLMHALLEECNILLLSTTHAASVDSLIAMDHILTFVCKTIL